MSRYLSKFRCLEGGWSIWTQISGGKGRPPPTIFGVRKLESLGYRMVKKMPKISTGWVGRTNVTDRQTDRQADKQTDDRRQTDLRWHIANVNASSRPLKISQEAHTESAGGVRNGAVGKWVPLRVGSSVGLDGWLYTEVVSTPEDGPGPSTNRAKQRRVTSLMRPTLLPLCRTTATQPIEGQRTNSSDMDFMWSRNYHHFNENV